MGMTSSAVVISLTQFTGGGRCVAQEPLEIPRSIVQEPMPRPVSLSTPIPVQTALSTMSSNSTREPSSIPSLEGRASRNPPSDPTETPIEFNEPAVTAPQSSNLIDQFRHLASEHEEALSSKTEDDKTDLAQENRSRNRICVALIVVIAAAIILASTIK